MNVPFPSEQAIEDFVCEELQTRSRCPISKDHVSDFCRQYKITGYGRTDILKIYAEPTCVCLTILELKNTPLTGEHLSQLARYMVGLRRQAARFTKRFDIDVYINGELAGPISKNPGDWVYVTDIIGQDITVYNISLDMRSGFQSRPVGCWYNMSENRRGGKWLARKCMEAMKAEQELIEAEQQEYLEAANG